MEQKIKTMLVDTSAEYCTFISQKMQDNTEIELISTVSELSRLRSEFLRCNPQALVVDASVFERQGIEFLKILMEQKIIPILVIGNNSSNSVEMLRRGAVDFIYKPRFGEMTEKWDGFVGEMVEAFQKSLSPVSNRSAIDLATAAGLSELPITKPNENVTKSELRSLKSLPIAVKPMTGKNLPIKIIAIGASTGGTEATSNILKQLPTNLPGIVVVQHMPAEFIDMYVKRLNDESELQVVVARSGIAVQSGYVYVSRGDCHLHVLCRENKLILNCSGTDKVSGHCPSVNVLFNSVAKNVGASAIGVLLTGMGTDGALGLLKMKKNGAYTIGQDEATSVVYGMPHEAYVIGAVTCQSPLDKIPNLISKRVNLSSEE